MRVSLFITCFNDTIFPETGRAVVRLLERLGHAVDFPMDQTCCGQMHFNTGYQREAMPLIRRFVEVFRRAEAVVAPSASCVGMVREFYPLAAEQAGDRRLAEDVAALAPHVFELSEFLVNKLGVVDVGGVTRSVSLACVVDAEHPIDACVGTWVLVHVGFAIQRVDEAEAARTLDLLRELGEVQARRGATS